MDERTIIMDERTIIYDCIDADGDMNAVVDSLMRWMSVDDLVDWFYRDYCEGDVNVLYERLTEDEAKAIDDYYLAHCA